MTSKTNSHHEVISLLDSDGEGGGSRPAGPKPGALKATKSQHNDGDRIAPVVPFHLFATTTSKSGFHNHGSAKKYFRTLRELIGLDTAEGRTQRKFQWLFVFNFLIDFEYLLEALLPDLLQFHRAVVFYGVSQGAEAMDQWKQLLAGTGNTVEFIQLVPSDPPRSRTNPLPMKIPYGVHHTKMFLVGYEDVTCDGSQSMCRVVVHTANLLLGDIEYKTQGAYCQDFPLKQKSQGAKMPKVVNPYKRKRDELSRTSDLYDEEETPFEDDLVLYLESYRYLKRQSWRSTSGGKRFVDNMSWLQLIRQYDFSKAYVVLIPSAPGRHKADVYHNFGFLKLRKAIVENVCPQLQDGKDCRPPPILCQFSSIGSLSEKWLHQFLSAIDHSATQSVDPIDNARNNGKKGAEEKSPPLSSRMKIVWPTMNEIRTSIEGYQGGAAVPGTVKNLSKEFLQPLFHRWSMRSRSGSNGNILDPLKTARHVPHIKTYLQPSSSPSGGIDWLVLTSHNLSMAAWGQLQQSSDQSRTSEKVLFIRHWELGVFMSPTTLSNGTQGVETKCVCITPYRGETADSKAVINVDSDDDGDDDKETGCELNVPLPFSMDPDRYDSNDVSWAINRSCPVPDAFGCIMP